MNEEQYKALVEKVGKEAADKIKALGDDLQRKFEDKITAIKAGTLTPEQFNEYKTSVDDTLKEMKEIAEKQGTTIQELNEKVNRSDVGTKSIAEVLEADKEELRRIYAQGQGVKEYMIMMNAKGEWVARPFDRSKVTGSHATVADIPNGATASVSQSFSAATLLRMGAGAPIISGFRNTPWIFDLASLSTASFDMPFFMWIDEQAKEGASTEVAEGGTKPPVQYKYALKSSNYRKEAMLLNFTEEFAIDFSRLQDDATAKGRIDLINRMNDAILSRVIAAATAYNSGAAFKGTQGVDTPNEYDVIAALCAQVENSTFAALANTAVMNTNKKYRMGILKDAAKKYLNPPDVLSNINYVSNPGMAADAILVGDLKQYNIALRGGMILRIGYNGTDFAENKFSQVIEQFYFDYISDLRKSAIVKGPDFATVKAAIGES